MKLHEIKAEKPLTFAQKLIKLAKEYGASNSTFNVSRTTSVQSKTQTWSCTIDYTGFRKLDLTELYASDDPDDTTIKDINDLIAELSGNVQIKVFKYMKTVAATKDWVFLGWGSGIKKRENIKPLTDADDLPVKGRVTMYFDNAAEGKTIKRKYTQDDANKELKSHWRAAIEAAGLVEQTEKGEKQDENKSVTFISAVVRPEFMFIAGDYAEVERDMKPHLYPGRTTPHKLPMDKKRLQKILDYYKPHLEDVGKKYGKPIVTVLEIGDVWDIKCAYLKITVPK